MKKYQDYINKQKCRFNKLISAANISTQDIMDVTGATSVATIQSWTSLEHQPPLSLLLYIAKKLKTNISYILGQTDIGRKCESYEINMDLCLFMNEAGYSATGLAEKIGTSTRIVQGYMTNPRFNRLNTLLGCAETFDVSIDCLLGLTDWRKWEYSEITKNPFAIIPASAAMRIVLPTGENIYGIMSADRKTVCIPNTNTSTGFSIYKKESALFKDARVYSLSPTEASKNLKINRDKQF